MHPSIANVELPKHMRALPVNDAGYPVPWFVAWINGVPDFRVADERLLFDAVRKGLCWICGNRMAGPTMAFTIGPMCAVNRTSSEPPSHRECAVYAAKACPFLANPAKRRREGNMPEHEAMGGTMIPRNPGVALVWITRKYSIFDDGRGGVLFDIGEPVRCLWFAESREATRAECVHSIETGLPIVAQMAQQDGPEAEEELARRVRAAYGFLPDAEDNEHEMEMQRR